MRVIPPVYEKLPGISCKGGVCRPEFAGECDVNRILERYTRTGSFGAGSGASPMFGDFSSGTDYTEACNAIAQANQLFADLPSHVRNEFDNSPAKLLDFLSRESNRARAIELGLLEPVPAPAAATVAASTSSPT